MSRVYFASASVKGLEAEKTLPFKFTRLLAAAGLPELVRNQRVCIKMHLGGKVGYTTIHPFFVHQLVEEVQAVGARDVFVTDGYLDEPQNRGYTEETFGCRIVELFREGGPTVERAIHYKSFDMAEISRDILDADVLIDFSHVKGHGDCGFGGAGKNIAMGCVPHETRGKIHALEGGIEWDAEKCVHCNKCIEECPSHANKFNEDDEYEVFWHDCKYCRHCVLICPEDALTTTDATFEDFQEGMARVVGVVLDHFGPDRVLCVNVLLNVTIYCDCWGFSTPALVPDVGILAGRDLVAVDQASLDLIKEEDLLPQGLPEGRELLPEGRHLFEKLHAKDPYLMGEVLARLGHGTVDYDLREVE